MGYAFDPAPRDASIVLSPEWLSQALRTTYPDSVVHSVVVVEAIETTAAKLRVQVTLSDGSGINRSSSLCIKGYFDARFAHFGTTGIHEARFYQRLAPQVPIVVPTVYYSGVNERSQHAVVVMDDLKASGSNFFDQRSYLDVGTVRQSLGQLARLHGRFWNNPIGSESWLSPKVRKYPGYIPDDEFERLLTGPRCEGLPPELRDGSRMKAAMFAIADRNASKPSTLLHADAHLGNLYRTADGDIGFADWQCYEFGHWSMDVAYNIAAALDPEIRGEHEADLLDFYLDELAKTGTPRIALSDAWDDYSASLIYGYFLWSMTRSVEATIVESMTQRLGLAASANGTIRVLGA